LSEIGEGRRRRREIGAGKEDDRVVGGSGRELDDGTPSRYLTPENMSLGEGAREEQ